MKIDVAELAGVSAEGPLFGIFLVLDFAAIYILTQRRRHSSINLPMLAASVIMLLLATTQFVVDVANIFMGFIPLARTGRLAFFADLTQPIFAAKHAIYFTMMLVGDSIVIYRCYVVWNRNFWIVLFPILCSMGSGACAYQTIWAIRHFSFHTSFIRLEHNMGFVIFSLSFGANAISTSLLAYKIWKADRNMRKTLSVSVREKSLVPVLRIVAESGAVNTAYLLTYTIILQSGTNGIQIMACIVTPLVGIIFGTVIIRAALANETEARTNAMSRGFTEPPVFGIRSTRSQNFTTVTAQDSVIEMKEPKPSDSEDAIEKGVHMRAY